MRTLSDGIRKFLAQKVQAAAGNVLTLEELAQAFVEPPNGELGDLAFGCFILGKNLKKAPAVLAAELKSQIQLDDKLLAVEAAGPYLNFTLSPSFVGAELLDKIRAGTLFKQKLTEKTPKTMIEFSQPNTHKELHVGHMRCACLGDALVHLHRYSGYELISSTFPGDVGTHVAKCLWYLKFVNKEPIPATNKGEWLGRMYSTANLMLEDQLGTPAEAENRKILTEILKQLENHSGEFYDLWKETRAWSVDLMKHVYDWAGIKFDQWYWESDVDAASVKYIKELKAQGKLVESQGATGMDLEADKLGFCLLLKSDGTGLYATKDVELARRKFQDFKVEKNIYVVDVRQELHFKQVFKVLEKLGFEQSKGCFHLKYNVVELPDGAMSSRKGNIVPLMELVQKMEAHVKSEYLSRYATEWTQEEINSTATMVAKGAIKYGMLRMDTSKKIVFDMNEWLKLDGESGPFIQYSGARIHSLVKKLGPVTHKPKWELLTHKSERNLYQALMNFHQVVLAATEKYQPHLLCTFAYDLSKRFNLFYHDCPMAKADSEDLKQARLALAESARLVLKQALELMGIPSPEKM